MLRSYVLLFGLLILFSNSWAQTGTIVGKVIDKETLQPLPFCNVFINNSTLSTVTDLDGQYILADVPIGDFELGISFIGYEYALKNVSMKSGAKLTFDVALIPMLQELSDVEIKASRDKNWERDLRRFKSYFLGADENASQTEILNPWVIDFSKSKNNEFTATAVQPIQIENQALGYSLVFDLKEFIHTPQYYRIIGVSRFSELETSDLSLKEKWNKNRLDTYLKSPANMFRALLDNRHENEGFYLYGDKPGGAETRNLRTDIFANELGRSIIEYKPENLVSPGKKPDEFRILLKGRIEVHYQKAYSQTKTYKDAPYPISWIEVNGNYVFVNKYGMVQNPKDVVFSGDMDNKKLASLLPLDYEPQLQDTNREVVKDAASMQEKVYIHTDRHFYYAGDPVFFKAYFNYASPELKNELSKVLHVELISENRDYVITKTYKIENGSVIGSFYLPDNLSDKKYFLRAFTTWNKNYGPDNYFIKPLPVLLPTDRIVGKFDNPNVEIGAKIKIETEPSKIKIGEKAKVSFELKDSSGRPINAFLSVAVTDSKYAGYLKENVEMDKVFPLKSIPNQVNTDKFNHPIEKSLSIKGRYFNEKGKPASASITAYFNDFQDAIELKSDSQGYFEIPETEFYGPMEFVFMALDKKGNTVGKFEKVLELVTPFYIPSHLRTPQIEEGKEPFFENFKESESIQLQEVIVNEANLPSSKAAIYGKPNFVIPSEKLMKGGDQGDLLLSLRGQVPGMTVMTTGVGQQQVRLRGGASSAQLSLEPTLMVNGSIMPTGGGATVADNLRSFNPNDIDRIEVINSIVPMLGDLGRNGVIAVFLKQGGANPNELLSSISKAGMNSMTYEGYGMSSNFPLMEKSEEEVTKEKDQRITLYWNPFVVTSTEKGKFEFEFYNNDSGAQKIIEIEGLTNDGKVIKIVKTLPMD
jgi:hypothetical protein